MAEWCGHLWQGRFASFAMDESYLYRCARYVEMNPVRAGLVKRPEDWPHSSARTHIKGKDDGLVKVDALLRMSQDWRDYLLQEDQDIDIFRRHERTGRPLGPESFVQALEESLGLTLTRQKSGPKPRARKRRR